jgi:16S rRNA (cytosine967-C5)-methyltransferase
VLREENEDIVDAFRAAHPQFTPLSCAEILASQRITVHSAEQLRLWPHTHGTDGFFAAAFGRQ